MTIKPEEISSIIEKELQKYQTKLTLESTGTVIQVGDAIARVYGLDDVMMGELVEFPTGVQGMVFNLEEDSVGIVIFGSDTPEKDIKEGDIVKRTGKIASIPVGKNLFGRVISPLGAPIDGKGQIEVDKYCVIETKSPNIIERQPIKESLETGIKAIDAMIPIGLGQRELVIGDRQTGKTAIVLDTIINQKGKGVNCIYVAIGQKISSIVGVWETLKKHDAMDYTIIVSATSLASAALQYLAPYSACAIAEEMMKEGKHVLVIFDDLTKHAQAYRQMSLLMRRPPGREAYPGDIFYLHSRLLERAAKLNDKLGGGSLTAIPIVETQAGDITSYIPTNVISITDGQIYLESDLFYSGVRPAINVGLSVSRVGGKAQSKAMRKVASKMRLDIAQYRELAAFTQFGSEVDKSTQAQLTRGERMVELLKQTQYSPLSLAKQIIIIYAGINGFLDDIPLTSIRSFEAKLFDFAEKSHKELLDAINKTKDLDDKLSKQLNDMMTVFKEQFVKEIKN
jgi:F-type H+/Na+-transporting ATPase subunit alpha